MSFESAVPSPDSYGPSPDGSSNEKKGDKKDSSSKSVSWVRVPLPASEVHGGGVRSKGEASDLPSIFGVKETPAEKGEKTTEPPKAEAVETSEPVVAEEALELSLPAEAAPARSHPELEGLKDELWQQFHGTEAAIHEPSHEARADGIPVRDLPRSSRPAPAEDLNAAAPAETAAPTPGEHEAFNTIPLHADHEGDIIAPPSAEKPALIPAAEANPDAPDPSTLNMWMEFNDTKPKEAPAAHPETQQAVNEQFQEIMNNAGLDPQFKADASAPEANVYVPSSYDPSAEAAPSTPYTTRPASAASLGAETVPQAAMPLPNREGYYAGAATGAVAGGIAGHMAGRRAARREVNELQHQLAQQEAEMQRLSVQTAAAQERPAPIAASLPTIERAPDPPRTEMAAPTLPTVERPKPALTPEQAPIPAATAAAIEAQQEMPPQANPDYRTEQSAWLAYAVDRKTGKMVQKEGVNQFGAELRHQQSFEAAPPDPPASPDPAAGQPAGTQPLAPYGTAYQHYPGQTITPDPTLMSGQVDPAHALPPGADPQHLLEGHENPVVTTLKSPLIWVGMGVLIAAYLAAAFL